MSRKWIFVLVILGAGFGDWMFGVSMKSYLISIVGAAHALFTHWALSDDKAK